MDVKNVFVNRYITEEVYVAQPKGFEDHAYPDHVYKLKKALYGLKQVSRAWYDRLSMFLLEQGFPRGGLDKRMFIKKQKNVYVDDIVFG